VAVGECEGAARIGGGNATVLTEFGPEKADLAAFNGGGRKGAGKVLVRLTRSQSSPPTMIIINLRSRGGGSAIFGSWSFERIGGGGSISNFRLRLHRSFRAGGESRSYFEARCPTGRLVSSFTGLLGDEEGQAGVGEQIVSSQSIDKCAG
jgi:hypothetical protein